MSFDPTEAGFGEFEPTINIALPGEPGAPLADTTSGVQLARPPLPNEQALRTCYERNQQREAFFECIVDQAMPREYRLARDCIQRHSGDGGRALVCSSGNPNLERAYERYRQVNDCARRRGNDQWDVAQCIGNATLGQNERYYLGCITRNKGDYKTAAVCALAKDLNPEQQIALSCAISTGGEPSAFAVCTGGQLLQRELDKCWDHGIATERGCFGPNNEYRRFLRGIDDQMQRTFGRHSVVYQSYQFWQNNVLAPGPNHELIRHVNNGLRDIRHGPGPNNEIIKAGNALGKGLRSVGKALRF